MLISAARRQLCWKSSSCVPQLLTFQHLLGAGHIFYISETRLLSWLQSVSLEERDGRLFSSQGSVVSGRFCRFIFVFRAPFKLVDDALYLDRYSGARYGKIDSILCELD